MNLTTKLSLEDSISYLEDSISIVENIQESNQELEILDFALQLYNLQKLKLELNLDKSIEISKHSGEISFGNISQLIADITNKKSIKKTVLSLEEIKDKALENISSNNSKYMNTLLQNLKNTTYSTKLFNYNIPNFTTSITTSLENDSDSNLILIKIFGYLTSHQAFFQNNSKIRISPKEYKKMENKESTILSFIENRFFADSSKLFLILNEKPDIQEVSEIERIIIGPHFSKYLKPSNLFDDIGDAHNLLIPKFNEMHYRALMFHKDTSSQDYFEEKAKPITNVNQRYAVSDQENFKFISQYVNPQFIIRGNI